MPHSIHTVTIKKKLTEVFAFCRNFKNYPKFIPELSKVKVLSSRETYWMATASLVTFEWQTKITQEIANELIVWQTGQDSKIKVHGKATFKKNPRGDTVVKFAFDYTLPGGAMTSVLASLLGNDPDDLLSCTLKRLKNYLEKTASRKKTPQATL